MRRAFETMGRLPAPGAHYLLPFGARSRFLFKMDFAEAEYIARLRSGVKGHFSYREIAWEMKRKMEQLEPELGRLIRLRRPGWKIPCGASGVYIVMMKRYRAVSLLAAAAWVALALLPAAAADLTVYFGTHTAGPGKGFSVSHFDTVTGALSKPEFLLETPAPAYFVIAPGGRRLYSCNSTGFVSAYSIDPATAQLKLINQKPSGGGDPSYISLDRTGHYVLVANYDERQHCGMGAAVPMGAWESAPPSCSTPAAA